VLLKLVWLLLLVPMVFAIPSCPSYPYKDYVWGYQYSSPARSADTFLSNCNALNLSDKSVCNLSGLSDSDKKQLISDAMVRNNGFPEHDNAKSWNYALTFTKYRPDNTNVSTTGSIRDAWVKIISLSPSVIENSTLWVSDSGELYSQFGFSFVVPKQTFAGDCRTDYNICGYDYALTNYLNNQQIGNAKKSNFTASGGHNSSQLFISKLNIRSEYLIHHYHLVKHCSMFGCWYSCDYYKTDDKKTTLQIQDSKQARKYSFIDFPNAIIDENISEYTKGWFFIASNEDYNKIRFLAGNSEITLQSREYKFKIENSPYNSLVVESSMTPVKITTKNIGILDRQTGILNGQEFEDYLKHGEPFLYFVLHDLLGINVSALPIQFKYDRINFLAPADSTNCSLEVYSHFESDNYSNLCKNSNQKPKINLSIENSTNSSFIVKAVFYDELSNFSLKDKKINLTYGDVSQTVITDAQGSVTAQFNRTNANTIQAEFITDFETRSSSTQILLPVQFALDFATLLYLIGLAVVAYLSYLFLRRFYK